MSVYTLTRDKTPVLEITSAEMGEINKLPPGSEVFWDRAGEKRGIPLPVLANALNTYRYNLTLLRHRRVTAVPPILIQLGQTTLEGVVLMVKTTEPEPESPPMKPRLGPPVYRPDNSSEAG